MEHANPDTTVALQTDRLLQAHTPDLPEVVPLDFPEVVSPNTPEPYSFDGLHTVEGRTPPPTQVEIQPPTKNCNSPRKRWGVIMLITAVVIAAAIGGGVGGTLERKLTFSTTASVPPNDSSPSPPPQSANPTDGPFDPSRVVLRNTSIASATCLNGDRWVFFQGTNGKIRGAQYYLAASTWTVASEQTIEAEAKIGTPLSASCVDIPASVAAGVRLLPPGLLISLIYLNPSNALQQSIYNRGAWRHTDFYAVTIPPANNTKLAITSTVVPALPVGNTMKASYFSSVAVYQSANGTFVMIDLFPQSPLYSPNLFSQFGSVDNAKKYYNKYYNLDIGVCLSCIHKAQSPTISSQLYTQCVLASGIGTWVYNQTLNYSEQTFDLKTRNYRYHGTTSLTDVALAPLSQGNVATVYLSGASHNLISTFIEPVPPVTVSNDNSSWETPIPYPRIGATSLAGNASLFYVHFQVNDTAIGELAFDLNSGSWVTRVGFTVLR